MNVPTHCNTMSDSDVLRDLFARNYGNSPMLGYVCDRWELLVEGEKDRQEELDKLSAEKESAEILVDEKQKEIDELNRQIRDLEREVERLSAQLNGCDPFGKMRG